METAIDKKLYNKHIKSFVIWNIIMFVVGYLIGEKFDSSVSRNLIDFSMYWILSTIIIRINISWKSMFKRFKEYNRVKYKKYERKIETLNKVFEFYFEGTMMLLVIGIISILIMFLFKTHGISDFLFETHEISDFLFEPYEIPDFSFETYWISDFSMGFIFCGIYDLFLMIKSISAIRNSTKL